MIAFQYLKLAHKKNRDFFSNTFTDRTRGNDFKLKERRFILDMKKEIFYNDGEKCAGQVGWQFK